MAKPYEPPPDYPMVEEPWRPYESRTFSEDFHHEAAHRISSGAVLFDPRYHERRLRRCPEAYRGHQLLPPPSPMLRTRQYPEVAGIFGCEEQPALRRFTRYHHEPPPTQHMISSSSTEFSKSSKKPSFFNGAWTFREKKPSRPPLQRSNHDPFRREERPLSMHCDVRVSRSRSETATRPPLPAPRKEFSPVPPLPSQPPPPVFREHKDFTTRITVDEAPILRNKEGKEERRSIQSSLRKSCPELETAGKIVIEPKRRARRAKEKARDAKWNSKEIQNWTLDDVLLWLQALQLDDVASVLIGYDMRGEDLLKWDDECLSQLGVTSPDVREKILRELKELHQRGPQKRQQRTLFELVKSTAYDQVLAVETPLTPRDVTVCSGRMGCLQITKVNGVNLPLREGDCLLEINECPGEQFKSALMLTRLITASRGEPIRFVLLRRHSSQHSEDSSNETSSSGISSSPRLSSE